MKIQSGSVQLFSHYQGGEMWTGKGRRVLLRRIAFDKPFRHTPHVMVAINGLDASNTQNTRVLVELQETFEDHFDVHVSTWAETRLASVTISWIAIDPSLFGVAEEPA